MASVLASSAVDCVLEPRSRQTKDYKIVICCFSAKHAALILRRKSKDRLARNQNNVPEWSNMSTRELLFQWVSTIQSNSAYWSSTKPTSSSSSSLSSSHLNWICSRHAIAEKRCWIGVKQQSLTCSKLGDKSWMRKRSFISMLFQCYFKTLVQKILEEYHFNDRQLI